MHMLKKLTAPLRIGINDLPAVTADAPLIRELRPDQLNLVVGGEKPADQTSGYICTATQKSVSEDCRKT